MRSKDRLEELRRLASATGDGEVYRETTLRLEEAQLQGGDARLDKDIDALLEEVERTRGWIHDIENNTQLVRRLHADPTFHTNRQLQAQLDAAATASNAAGLKVCGALRQLEERARAGGGAGGGTCGRMARLHAAAARRLASAALQRHHAALHALRDQRLHLLRDQIRLTNQTISEEECQTLLDTDNVAMFVDNVRAETAEARRALREVEARHEELLRVEGSLRALRDLFEQLAHLVALQQEQVDSVEYYALQAGEHVESGGHQLLKGSVSHAKARKKKLSLIICLASGFLLVLLVLIFT